MKILFYVQRIDDAHLAHSLAVLLQKRLGLHDFAAITFRQNPEGSYLQQEAAPLFRQILSETDMHSAAEAGSSVAAGSLERIEDHYGLPFWHYVTQNRFLILKRANFLFSLGTPYSREALLRHVQLRFEMTERFLDSVKPDLILYSGVDVGPSSALILERVAKVRGIPILVPLSAKIGSYHTLVDTVFSKANHIEKRFRELQAGAVSKQQEQSREIIAKFRAGKVILPYIQNVKVDEFERSISPPKMLAKLRKVVKKRIELGGIFHRKYDDPFNLSQLEYEIFRLGIEYRNFRLKFGHYFQNPVEGEKNIFFPLHLEPELALLLYAPYQIHQTATVQYVAQSLPWDSCLYVKEHPQSVGKKSLGFYRRLATTPNVRSIYPHLSSRSLIAQAQGVITITGTAGMEAMLMGKPAITLGDVFYTFVEGLVERATSLETLPNLVKWFDTFKADEQLLQTFVAAILDESVEVDPEVLALRFLNMPLEAKLQDPDLLKKARD
jgi:hypothetical protein